MEGMVGGFLSSWDPQAPGPASPLAKSSLSSIPLQGLWLWLLEESVQKKAEQQIIPVLQKFACWPAGWSWGLFVFVWLVLNENYGRDLLEKSEEPLCLEKGSLKICLPALSISCGLLPHRRAAVGLSGMLSFSSSPHPPPPLFPSIYCPKKSLANMEHFQWKSRFSIQASSQWCQGVRAVLQVLAALGRTLSNLIPWHHNSLRVQSRCKLALSSQMM